MDDDEAVLDTNKEILLKLGYRVLSASGGAQAIGVYEKKSQEIDLAILDVVMPHVDGIAVFKRIIQIDPLQKVLFSTGCDIADELAEMTEGPELGIIQKPYSIQALSEKIIELIG